MKTGLSACVFINLSISRNAIIPFVGMHYQISVTTKIHSALHSMPMLNAFLIHNNDHLWEELITEMWKFLALLLS